VYIGGNTLLTATGVLQVMMAPAEANEHLVKFEELVELADRFSQPRWELPKSKGVSEVTSNP
jgi:hypothetical protein